MKKILYSFKKMNCFLMKFKKILRTIVPDNVTTIQCNYHTM